MTVVEDPVSGVDVVIALVASAVDGPVIGTITITPLTAWLIERFSVQAGFLAMGGLLLVLGTLIAQIMLGRTVPEAYGLRPDGNAPPTPRPRPASCCRTGPASTSGTTAPTARAGTSS